jgi:hypothetical protein
LGNLKGEDLLGDGGIGEIIMIIIITTTTTTENGHSHNNSSYLISKWDYT